MKKLGVYIILMTWLFANMDWQPIHYAWWHNGAYPLFGWGQWAVMRTIAALVFCPPCGALAENYYYVLLEHDAGTEEQAAVLKGKPYTHNPFNPHGDWSFYWGQGEGREWRRVSMLSWYLWWTPITVIWWQFAKRFFV